MKKMIEVRKAPIDGADYQTLKEKNFFDKKEYADMVDETCHTNDVELYVALSGESGEIYGFLLISMATKDAISILKLSISADFGHEDLRKALLDLALEDKKPKAMVGEVTQEEVAFFEDYGFYTTEIGENLPGEISYYATYRNV